VLFAGVLGILICAVMLIIGRRNRSATAYEGLVGSAWILGGLALASVAAVVVGAFQV
jgi:cytosine/uracil/thiamine/allantoin permease